MKDMICAYQGNRGEALLAHLYEEGNPAERAAFEVHLGACSACRAELAELAAVRAELGRWTPPEPARALTFELPSDRARRSGVWAVLREVPAWAQVAAALLVAGVAAGVANLEVKYDRDGLVVRTGWLSAPASDVAAPAAPVARQAVAELSPSRAELTALEQQLRAELRAATARPAVQAPAPGGEAVLRRVQAMVEESERRQQKELALRIGDLLRDVQAQRAADLVRIDRTLGYIQNDTGTEVMRQRRLLNDLAVRVTQRQ